MTPNGIVALGAVLGGFDGRRGLVYHVAVDPQARGQGLGSALMDELERRLRNRNLDTPEVVGARMAKAMDEISHYDEYDYVVVNTDLNKALVDIQAILNAERLKRRRQTGIEEFVSKLI